MEDRNKRSKVINIISNVLFGIVMVLLVIFMIYGFGSIANNKVPSFFGRSYVRILSSSMNDPAYKDGEVLSEGFERGDIAVLKKVNISEIEVGDIIAFYYCPIVQSDFNGSDNVLDFKTGENSFDTNIIFHQVVDIQVDSQGYTWFQTQGTSNSAADKYTRADYVVGVYTPSGLAGFLEFISSTVGIIVLVVVPACIVLFMLLLSIIDTVDKMLKQKREAQEMEAAIMQTINNNQEIKTSTNEAPKDIGLSESTMAEFNKQMKKIESEGGTKSDTAQAKVQTTNSATAVPPKPPVKPTIAKPAGSTQTASAKPVATDSKVASTKPATNADVKTDAKTDAAKPASTTAKAETKPAAAASTSKAATASTKETATATAKPAAADSKSATAKPATSETKTTSAKQAESSTKSATSAQAKATTANTKTETPASKATTQSTSTKSGSTKQATSIQAKSESKSTSQDAKKSDK